MSHNRESYGVIEAKLELAELTIELMDVRGQKWERLDKMKHILQREEGLMKSIEGKTVELKKMIEAHSNGSAK